MSGRNRLIVGVIAVVVILGIAAGAYVWFSGGTGEASRETVAPTLALNRPTTAPTAEATVETAAVEAVETAEPAAAATVEAVEATEPAAASSAGGEGVLFNIVGDESEVSFSLTEDLRGVFTTVVGVTNDVAGQIFVDFDNPAQSQVGVIRINARTLTTDNEFRNRAIRGQILLSAQDEFEFIDFTPTGVEGLPDAVTIGEPITFQLIGDLTIRDITNPVTFDVTVTPVSEERLEGVATAVVQRGDYNLQIPDVPSVANVSEDVTLQIEFVAAAA